VGSLFAVALIWLLPVTMASADVLHDLAAKQSFAGDFEQRVLSPSGGVIETATGNFRFMRPDYFWWQIDSPEHQLLVATGDTLTQIDWDLEVVVEREITAETRSALHWLLAPRSELEGAFNIELSEYAVSLTPVGEGAGFLNIVISHTADNQWTLRITDLGYQLLEFSMVEDPAIVVDASGFTLPELPF
jgi:outer membrane lipoprotein carrier protein